MHNKSKSRKSFSEISTKSKKKRVQLLTKLDKEKISRLVNSNETLCLLNRKPSSQSEDCIADDVIAKNGNFENDLNFENDNAYQNLLSSNSENSDIDDDVINSGIVYQDNPLDTKYNNLETFLPNFSTIFDIKANAMTFLLKGLKQFGHEELPACARTLMKTPRISNIENLDERGQYVHYDLKKALIDQLSTVDDSKVTDIIDFFINADGISFSRCSKNDLWPIMGIIDHKLFTRPFIIDLYHGSGKPMSATKFLQAFIEEFFELNQFGFTFNNGLFKVNLKAVLANTPARNFIVNFPAHNSR